MRTARATNSFKQKLINMSPTRFFLFVFVFLSAKAFAQAAEQAPPPVTIEAERIEGDQQEIFEASGQVELREGEQAIFADHLKFFQISRDLQADGNVRVEKRGDVLRGPKLNLNLDTQTGEMPQPEFRLVEETTDDQTGKQTERKARGAAATLLFEGKNLYRLKDTQYTTCPAGNDDWFLRVSDLAVDRNEQIGVAKNARIVFKQVPIMYTPWMDFALGGQRKSGLLAPIFGSTASGGTEIAAPFYWNIAANRDATLTPRLMSKRGVMLGNEFRYLEKSFNGVAHLDMLPDDRIANRGRYGMSLLHDQRFGEGWSGGLNLNRVSDDAYFRDLANGVTLTTQTNLLRQGTLSYGGHTAHGSWSFNTLVQRFQTLQDPLAPITPPYYRTPQLTLSANRQQLAGADLNFSGGWVDFSHPTLINGKRLTLYPSISYPLQNSFAHFTPKLGLHHTRYDLAVNPIANPATPAARIRNVPIFSLDSGVVFERDLRLRGERFIQTLEPRAYYVRAPFRDQSTLPNFDSAEIDFNFAQMFAENRFSGEDRINDADQVTIALTSRLLDPDNGSERLRVAGGQRLHFRDRRVTLGTPPVTGAKSDFLLALGGQIAPKITADAGWQYNQNLSRTEKFNTAIRYQAELGKVINLGYRYTNSVLRQVDASAQWPLSGRWHGVARINYSLNDRKILEGLGGLEYNAACWSARFVFQRYATATQEAATAIFVQLELSGLTQIGSNPLDTLKRSVPGYQRSGGR